MDGVVDDGISIATGLINTVHIVKGAVPDETPDPSKPEFTQWATIRVVGEGKRDFMWRSYVSAGRSGDSARSLNCNCQSRPHITRLPSLFPCAFPLLSTGQHAVETA